LTKRHQPIFLHGGRPYYIRAEKTDLDLSEALSKAEPIKGETVLNTVEI
jgi:hypothetical protein